MSAAPRAGARAGVAAAALLAACATTLLAAACATALLAAACATTLLAAACATAPEPVPLGTLTVECSPEDAEVWIDDDLRGACGVARPLPLPVGLHRVEVRRRGWFTAYAEATVREGEVATVRLTLRQVPE